MARSLLPLFTALVLITACGDGESPDPQRAAAYDDGWNKGIAYIVCELADGESCFEDLWLSTGSGQGEAAGSADEGIRTAYWKGHGDGADKARSCLEHVIKSMSGDLWETIEIEGVGMDFERAVTAFQVLASQAEWDSHGECVSEVYDNPYE